MKALALALLSACSASPPPITSCGDSLTGVWRGPTGDWEILDARTTLEAFPLFADAAPAPRALALLRTGSDVRGEVKRRYMEGDAVCVAAVPVRFHACTTQNLELTLSDPSAPTTYAPCTFSSRTNPSRREKWQRVTSSP